MTFRVRWDRLAAAVRRWVRASPPDREVDEEVASVVDLLAAEKRTAGVPAAQARREALREHGRVGSVYVNEFWRKWIADLGNSFDTVRQMQKLPFGRETVLRMMLLISLPLLPLVFTLFSLEKAIRCLAQYLF